MKTLYPQQSGFSLVEVLVSITILLMVIVGPMTMISRANNSTSFATEQINAWFLAQEGLELIEKQRDDYMLQYFKDPIGGNDNPWADFINKSGTLQFCYNNSGCGVTIGSGGNPSTSFVNCATGVLCRLYIDDTAPSRSVYVYNATLPNTASLFTRVITLENDNTNPDQVKVTSTVTWRTGTLIASQKVEATTYLFNVYDTP